MTQQPAVAEVDPSLPAATAEVRRLLGVLASKTGEGGPRQGLADVAGLIRNVAPDARDGLLVAALWMLSDRGAQPPA